MNAIYLSIPIAFLIAGIGLITLIYLIKSGQFEDVEMSKHRIFFEDEENGD